MNIIRNGSQPSSRGLSDYFTGDVRADARWHGGPVDGKVTDEQYGGDGGVREE
jgi:hypothetical protein